LKTGEFWSNTKRYPSESIDAYFNRFHELLDDLSDAEEPVPIKSAIRHFIFTLGPEFDAIQSNYRIGNLPAPWNTQDWPTLLVLCRDYYNSVKPFGNVKKDTTHSPSGNNPNAGFDRLNHQKKVRLWFLNPTKYCKEIEKEQEKHPDKCIFHLSSSHPTATCNVKLECDKIRVSKTSSSTLTSGTTGQLRHITEEDFVDAASFEENAIDVDSQANDTKEDGLLYFARITNHYLRLARASPMFSSPPRHHMKFPVIADSGANFHMFKEQAFFTKILPATGRVILGDGKTNLSVQGIGTVRCLVDGKELFIENVRYIPDLSESIYSLFQHIQLPGHALHSSFEEGLFITYPTVCTKAIIGDHDIYINMIPVDLSQGGLDTQSDTSIPIIEHPKSTVCRRITEFQEELQKESSYLDHLLSELRNYYDSVKTRRQLHLEVPAGFRQSSSHVKDLNHHLSSRLMQSTDQILDDAHDNSSPVLSTNSDTTSLPIPDLPANTDSSSLATVFPIIRSVDKPSSSLPQHITMTEDFLRAGLGFRRIDTLKSHLRDLYQTTISIDSLPADAVLDSGDLASLRKKPRNTTPVPRPSYFGAVVHMDIVFGPEIALGNIHYGILFTDQYSRMSYLYPLQNLTSDIPKQLQAFFAHIGSPPTRLITDFDLKLIGGKAREYLNSLLIHVNAAPSLRQDKNGLVERHWQTMVLMARNWLASAELPSTFWYYAVKRAAEVCNYFPYKLEDGSFTTPFELAHNIKPDLRVIFKMFGLAAVRRERVGEKTLSKFDSQSSPMIAVGRCPQSDGLQFYNPINGTFVTSIDYKFQNHCTSGAKFGYQYQPGMFIYRLDETNSIFTPKFPLDSEVLVHTHSPPHVAKVIGIPSYDRPDIYTVLFSDGSITEYSDTENILTLAPSTKQNIQSALLPSWIQDNTNATLFLSSMSKPRHGKLRVSSDNIWIFCPGNQTDLSQGISLPDLSADCQYLLDTGQLFRGHCKFSRVYNARAQIQLKDSILRHVSAHGLASLVAPTSLRMHSKLSSTDKQIWDDAYNEEFDGLSDLPTWEVLSESQFKQLSNGVKALPSMAIATIKYDALNKPKRAKYRIVVLGNHDYHTWSKEATAAPVMSQMELRLLTALAISHKRVLKNCDIKQAFVQSSLPKNENYFVKPPIGCPKSTPGTYWRLIRS